MRRLLLACMLIAGTIAIATIPPSLRALAQDAAPSSLVINTRPITFSVDPKGDRYGLLEWRGGLVLSSRDPRFGGLSSMIVSDDGSRLLAVSDDGWWLRLKVRFDRTGRLEGVEGAEMAAILDKNGKRFAKKSQHDAEALTALSEAGPDGPVAVGFENRVRIDRYDLGKKGLEARPEPMFAPLPERLRKGPGNKELEALAWFPAGPLKGRVLAISEDNQDDKGNIRAWIVGGAKPRAFSVTKFESFAITDVTILPGGDLVTVERDFSRLDRRLRMAIRRFPASGIKEGAVLDGQVLLVADWPRDSIDNMEAIASYLAPDGEERLLIMSDDNYNGFLQRTLLLQFALPAKAS